MIERGIQKDDLTLPKQLCTNAFRCDGATGQLFEKILSSIYSFPLSAIYIYIIFYL